MPLLSGLAWQPASWLELRLLLGRINHLIDGMIGAGSPSCCQQLLSSSAFVYQIRGMWLRASRDLKCVGLQAEIGITQSLANAQKLLRLADWAAQIRSCYSTDSADHDSCCSSRCSVLSRPWSKPGSDSPWLTSVDIGDSISFPWLRLWKTGNLTPPGMMDVNSSLCS